MPRPILDGPVRHATRQVEKRFNAYLASLSVDEDAMNLAIAGGPIVGIGVAEGMKMLQKRKEKRAAEPTRAVAPPPTPTPKREPPREQQRQEEQTVNGPSREEYLA